MLRPTTGCNVLYGSESCFQGLKQSDPIDQVRESRLISIQRPKKWFRILLNCAKLKFVSYTSNSLEQMYDFQKRTMLLQKWILNLQDLLQNRSLETVPACIVLQCYHMTILFVFTCVMNVRNRFRRLSQALVHFAIDRASLFTDHRISGLPIRAKYKHFKTI